ncbi:MAG: Mg(2+) transport ATPase, P-type [Brockia lithotrophica]|uniref:Magnesium-transporting ATPase, P-type 1 n=1 Tax=Brockia lithotrophica TaxID=933949 RepID=A0A2T5G631_9BACL|nr:MAG: Mg(2+) transport ATPase, P-type [Brockia lithotrophica]
MLNRIRELWQLPGGNGGTKRINGAGRAPRRRGGLDPIVELQSREMQATLLEVSDLPVEAVYERLRTTPAGLSDDEVEKRLEEFGPNEIPEKPELTVLRRLYEAFVNPFNVVLLLLAVVSTLTDIVFVAPEDRDPSGVIIILTMVTVSGILRFVQEWRSDQAAEKLKQLVDLTIAVRRAGRQPTEIRTEELVPGDVVHLAAGDMIPADLRIVNAKDFFVNQSALTGEAEPVEKVPTPCLVPCEAPPSSNPLERHNLAFMGSSVVSGSAVGVVVATGPRTYFGHVAKTLTERREATSFEVGVNRVSWLLIRFMLAMVPVVFFLNFLTKRDWLDALLFSLAVAVGLTPEMLPMIVTAGLAKGAVFMSKKKVIVKRLSAMQNFGAMDVLCTDKTGTLTQDKIVLEFYLDVHGDEEPRVLKHAFLNSYFQTGLKNVMDRAILAHVGEEFDWMKTHYEKVDEIPFDFVRRRMSVVVRDQSGKTQLITKGAVEEMLKVCSHVEYRGQVVHLTEELRREVLENVYSLNAKGLRVLAVAQKTNPPPVGQFTVEDERDMVLMGYLAFLDPPKESAPKTIAELKEHGIELKILTGDNDVVTKAIADQVGIDTHHILLGADIEAMGDETLRREVERTTVFAKLSPAHKARIVKALRENGHTVGFLGDGINDAPAMHAADVGISVENAVDIAKEAADIILLERDLGVLVDGVVEGRRTFGNIMKYIKITASSNFGNVFSVLVASWLLPFLPMQPIQLLFLNLTYDLSMTTMPWDRMDREYLKKPRKWDAPIIGRYMIWLGPTSSVFDITTYALMFFLIAPAVVGGDYFALPDELKAEFASVFQTGWFVESLWTQTLVVHMLRTEKIPFLQSLPGAPLFLATALAVTVDTLVPYTPIGAYLGMTPLPGFYFPWLVATLLSYLVLAQFVKIRFVRRYGYLI